MTLDCCAIPAFLAAGYAIVVFVLWATAREPRAARIVRVEPLDGGLVVTYEGQKPPTLQQCEQWLSDRGSHRDLLRS